MEANLQADKDVDQRLIRVFISSTFRDMGEEREELVKYVFPELKRRLSNRYVDFVPIDLRWGITASEAENGEVIPICLNEIDQSRPYFICLLGERYGWIPDDPDQVLLENQYELYDYQGKSVTELEIEYGALKLKAADEGTIFYFRDKAFSEKVEKKLSLSADFIAEDANSAEKLVSLKKRIRKSGYRLRENYANVRDLANLILKDLWEVIEARFPKANIPSQRELQRLENESFAHHLRQVYVIDQAYLEQVNQQIIDCNKPLVLSGSSGSGKSALVANLLVKFKQQYPDYQRIVHFIGVTSDSSNKVLLIKRTMQDIASLFFSVEEEQLIPEDPNEMLSVFPTWLEKIASKGKLLLVFDSIDRLLNDHQGIDLSWLPTTFPTNIKVLITTTPGVWCDALLARNWQHEKIKALTQEQVSHFSQQYLISYSKKLDRNQLLQISQQANCSHPLFLKTLLNEIRQFGDFERLNEKISHYLSCQSIDVLFEYVLERLEQDYQRDRPNLIQDVMSAFWASRKGLTEIELLEILGDGKNSMPHMYWSPLFLSLQQLLSNHSGLLNFSSQYLKKAVAKRYLSSEKKTTQVYQHLANYFQLHGDPQRKIDELPWLLLQTQQWQQLYQLLSEPVFFAQLWGQSSLEAKSYWLNLEKSSDYRVLDAYKPIILQPEKFGKHIWQISQLLSELGYNKESEPLLKQLIQHFQEKDDEINLSAALSNYANLLKEKGDLDNAIELYQQAQQLGEKHADNNAIQRALGHQALIFQQQGNFEQALALLADKEKICLQINNQDGLQNTLGNKAVILQYLGQLDQAMLLYQQKEQICLELGNPEEQQLAMSNRAGIILEQGLVDDALLLYQQAQQISLQFGNKNGLQNALTNQAVIAIRKDNNTHALELLEQAEIICHESSNKEGLQRIYGLQAHILLEQYDYEKALDLARKQENYCRQYQNLLNLASSLSLSAIAYRYLGKLEQAIEAHKEEAEIYRKLNNPQALQQSLINRAMIEIEQGTYEQALNFLAEAEQINISRGKQENLAIIYSRQALIKSQQGEMKSALLLLNKEQKICLETANLEGLRLCYNAQAKIHISMRKKSWPLGIYHIYKANSFYRLSEKLARQLEHQEGVMLAMANQAIILVNSKQVRQQKRAIPLLQQAAALAGTLKLQSSEKSLSNILQYLEGKLK